MKPSTRIDFTEVLARSTASAIRLSRATQFSASTPMVNPIAECRRPAAIDFNREALDIAMKHAIDRLFSTLTIARPPPIAPRWEDRSHSTHRYVIKSDSREWNQTRCRCEQRLSTASGIAGLRAVPLFAARWPQTEAAASSFPYLCEDTLDSYPMPYAHAFARSQHDAQCGCRNQK
jgi:hypothetical protein